MSLGPVLALAVLTAYVASLWWLLRQEKAEALVWLMALTGLAACLRVVYTSQYPDGMNEDEVKVLWCGVDFLRAGHFFVDDCSDTPGLLTILFPAQLAQLIGPSRWAIRGLSLLGSVLAVPAAFGAARSLGLRVAPSLSAAGFVAVLPWALFYGRVHQSGELVFEALLVVAFLCRFLRGRGGWPEIVLGGIALTLLMQTYYSGRTLVGVTLLAAVLAPGRYRLHCLALLLVALLGFAPYYFGGSSMAGVGFSSAFVQPGMREDVLGTLARKALQAAQTFVAPVADDRWLTIRTAAMHPLWILALAVIGSCTGIRRGLFLWGAFLGCVAPAIIGYGGTPSARRMLMSYPLIALAAACAVDIVPWRRVRAPLCAVLVLVATVSSVRFFFSSEFWRPESLFVFDAERWDLIDSLPPPPHPRVIVTRDLGYHAAARFAVYGPDEVLFADNWFPVDGEAVIYAFGPEFGDLRPLYESLFGVDRVHSFRRAFSVQLEPREWSWLREFGWQYQARCGTDERAAQVPFLFGGGAAFRDQRCEPPESVEHTWRGKWLGPSSKLRLYARGEAEAQVDGVSVWHGNGWDLMGEFEVRPGSRVSVRVKPPPTVDIRARLVRLNPAGEQALLAEWVAPDR